MPFPTHRENKSVMDGAHGTRGTRVSVSQFGAFDYRGGSHHRRIRRLSSQVRLDDGFSKYTLPGYTKHRGWKPNTLYERVHRRMPSEKPAGIHFHVAFF